MVYSRVANSRDAGHFAWIANHRSEQLRQAVELLELRVSERTVELQHRNQDLRAEIIERKRAEDSLRSLSARLLDIQEEERRRIARDLHDGATQSLAAVAINMDHAQLLAKNCEHPLLSSVLRASRDSLEQVMLEI